MGLPKFKFIENGIATNFIGVLISNGELMHEQHKN